MNRSETTIPFEIWKTIKLSSGEEVDLVILSSKEIGLPHGAYLSDLLKNAQRYGLLSCTEETATHLNNQYRERPYWESLHFGMNPMRRDEPARMVVYKLEQKKLVEEACPHPQGFWGEFYKWIFIRPRE